MDLPKAISERLAFALNQNKIDATYREQILSVGAKFIGAQTALCKSGKSLLYLPYYSCQACFGDTQKIVGVSTSWLLLQVAAYLLDKVEDAELAHATPIGVGVTTNLSTGMIFIAEWILNHLELDRVDPAAAWDIQRAFHESVLSVCSGQHLDLCSTLPDLDDCWSIAQQKSGAVFSLACYSGGRLAGHDSVALGHLEEYGRCLGTIIQIGDDLDDLLSVNRSGNTVVKMAPIFQAYRSYLDQAHGVGDFTQDHRRSDDQNVMTKGSVLYLKLEALKLAATARSEIEISGFSEPGKTGLLTILQDRPVLEGMIN